MSLQLPTTKPPSFESFVIPQISTATVSFGASAMMAITIARSGNRLSVPYRRIIFGLSISDMAQSLGLIIGPFSVPSDTHDCWGLGNAKSCRISAIIHIAGLVAVPMYTCFTCWYYLCKLKYRMSNDDFTHQKEIKTHAFIIIFVTVLVLVALPLDVFHTVPAKTHCSFATVPLGCRVYPDFVGDCDSTITARVHNINILVQSIRAVCILGMVGMMSLIICHAIKQIRIFQPRGQLREGRRFEASVPNMSRSQQRVSYLSSLYRNEIMIQAIFYVGAFCVTYIPDSILFCILEAGGRPPKYLRFLMRYTLPLGGLFNILTYSRPQVASLRRAHPDRSWFLCLWLVLRAGGELPPERGSFSENEGPRYSFSSAIPYGVTDDSQSFASVEVFDGQSLSLRDSHLNFNPVENWSYVRGEDASKNHDGGENSPGRPRNVGNGLCSPPDEAASDGDVT